MDYDLWLDPALANVRKLLRIARDLGLEAPESAEELEVASALQSFWGLTQNRCVHKCGDSRT
jgi:hypothetical protein